LTEYDLVVIGGGSGGLVVASIAAQLKAKVALIERDRLGGDCLWHGCVPSKALIEAARAVYQIQQAARLGIYSEGIRIDFAQVMSHVQNTIAAIAPHDSPERFRGLGVEVIFGEGSFVNPQTFRVNGRSLKAGAFVIATGSRPKIPQINGIEQVDYLTNKNIFDLTECPKSLIVLGGGAVGCELGQAFSRLGSKVTILASSDRLLPKEEPEISDLLKSEFQKEGISVINNLKSDRIEFESGEYVLKAGAQKYRAEKILIATGRLPNTENLNLEAAGIKFSDQGIAVNENLQTSNARIYACGDAIGKYNFTHAAGTEAVTVAKNALFFPLSKMNWQVIPWATFTDPEIAHVGMTEAEAIAKYPKKGEIQVLQQPNFAVDRAHASGNTVGFAKIICRSNGEILGAHLIGAESGELIQEIVVAMQAKLKISALTGIHIYPTRSELISKTALQQSKQNYAQNLGLQNLLSHFFSIKRRLNQ
jgi:pyruvate/2-oxoglutarate dehydrogenase complex dihydrolipoamide dehydrogenase (E3) component